MFYLLEAGEVTGPHTAGAVRRGIEAGRVSWEDQACDLDTREWVPLETFRPDIYHVRNTPAPVDASRMAARLIAVQEESRADRERKKLKDLWQGGLGCALLSFACTFFGLGIGATLFCFVGFLAGVSLLFSGGAGRGIVVMLINLPVPLFYVIG